MERRNRLLGSVALANGLVAHFYDRSRKVAGDRWQVELAIEIPIDAYGYEPPSEESSKEYRAFLEESGGRLVFRQSKVRNFVAEDQVEPLLETLKREFLDSNRAYLNHPRFAALFLKQEFTKWKERKELEARRAALHRGAEP